jgi:hypothetical protein
MMHQWVNMLWSQAFILKTTLVFSAVLLGLGCSDDDEKGRSVENWCDAYCSWSSACDGYPASFCTSACIADDGGFPDYGYRPFYMAVGQCLKRNSDCTGGHDESWSACAVQASLEIESRQSIFDLCEALADVMFECGYRYAPETCAGDFSYLNDAAAEQVALDCAAVTCDTFDECLSNSLEQGYTL